MDTKKTDSSQSSKTIRTGIKIGYQGQKAPANVSIPKNQGVSTTN